MEIALSNIQAFWLLNGAVSLLLYPMLIDVINTESNSKLSDKLAGKIYLFITDDEFIHIHLGTKANCVYYVIVVENLLDSDIYNLMYDGKIIGAINKKSQITGKIHLGEFTSGKIKTCHLYQLQDFPNYFLLKDGKTGGDLSIDERPFLTVKEI